MMIHGRTIREIFWLIVLSMIVLLMLPVIIVLLILIWILTETADLLFPPKRMPEGPGR